jgi:hypothetical protein
MNKVLVVVKDPKAKSPNTNFIANITATKTIIKLSAIYEM